MVTETIAIIAVLAAATGASLNAVRAWWDAPDTVKFSPKKFAASLVSGVLTAVALIQFTELGHFTGNGIVALIVTELLAGYGASAAVSRLHK